MPALPNRATVRLPAGALLVTAGGGGDGVDLMRQVVAAYEADPSLDGPVVMVLGPFMKTEERDEMHRRAARLPALHLLTFDNRLETLIQDASAVVGMGGYNTFCEILSLDKRALIVPRVTPREEQLIRARRAAELGLVDVMLPTEARDPRRLAAALHRLPLRPRPSETSYGRPAGRPGPLGGLDRIGDLVHDYVAARQIPLLKVLAGGKADG